MGIFYDHVALASTDPDRSVAFYRDVMGFQLSSRKLLDDGREQAVFHIGDGILVVFHHEDNRYVGKIKKPRSGMHHLAFGMNAPEFDAILDRCKAGGVTVRRLEYNSGAKGLGFAAYFYDPDGNEIEIKKYEPDPDFQEHSAPDYHI